MKSAHKKEMGHKEHKGPSNRQEQVRRPNFSKGQLQQSQDTKVVLTAWDEMLVSKAHPGQFNAPYVAGMNCTNLPTSTFSVSNSFPECNLYGTSVDEPLGTAEYTVLLWANSCTAFSGDGGGGNISPSDRLGGLVIMQVKSADLQSPWISREVFQKQQSAYTMQEVYGSNLTGFSAGGFIWASEATMNVLTPAANLVGSYYKGTMQFGQLPSLAANGLSLQ